MDDAPQPAAPVPPEAAAPPPRRGMSTGAKVAIGCGILVALALIVSIIVAVAGGMFLKKKAGDFAGGMEAQEEAAEKIQALERDHPFTPPAPGVVSEDRAQTFLAVTDDAWEAMRESMEEMADRGRRIDEGGQAGMRDAMAGIQALGRSRIALAEALDDHDMPVSEYLWTGLELVRAYQARDMDPAQSGVPAANVELARRHAAELADIAEDRSDGRSGKGAVLAMAWTWAGTEGVRIQGWDTLGAYVPEQP